MKKEMYIITEILIVIVLLVIALIGIADTKDISNLEKRAYEQDKRIKQLEIDYKIYEINLSELQENKETHFGNN